MVVGAYDMLATAGMQCPVFITVGEAKAYLDNNMSLPVSVSWTLQLTRYFESRGCSASAAVRPNA